MGVSNEELLKLIKYYQESFDRYTLNKNDYKILNAIEKLKKLPIATAHLEQTGIGRTVNALRKLGGEVGDAAKGLVGRWKEMVLEEEESGKKKSEDPTDAYEEKTVEPEDTNVSISSRISNHSEKDSDNQRKKDTYASSDSKHSSKEKRKNDENSHKKRKREDDSDNEKKHKKRYKSSDSSSESEEESSEPEEKIKTKSKHTKHHHRYDSESDKEFKIKDSSPNKHHRSSNKDHKSSSKSNSKFHNSSDSEDSYKEHKSRNSNKDHRNSNKLTSKNHQSSDSEDTQKEHRSRSSSKNHSSSKSNSGEKKHDNESKSSREEKLKSKRKSDSKSKRESDCEETKSSSSSKHKSDKGKSKESEGKSKSKHETKPTESESHLSHSDKRKSKEKSEHKSSMSKEKEKHSHTKGDNRKHEENHLDKHKKSKEEKENGSERSSSSKNKSNDTNKTSSSKHKSSSDKKEKLPKSGNDKMLNGINSESGASFADALGMCEPVISTSSVIKKKRPASFPSMEKSEKPKASSSYSKLDSSDDNEDNSVPDLLKKEPTPLNINIASLLPEITPHYRPLGLPIDSQPRKLLSQEDALSQAISNKNMRTKVYSGNKSHGKVDTLFDLCVRILQDNIDALEYTGGVPYIILKPVLEKATPDQLFNMEHHNPYLIEDTDGLWQLHCQKEFRTKKREELESWREMYMRCLDEREARLNVITASIKQAQDKSIPVRTTKLAYVDSYVKPPRNIAKKQAKNGILVDKRPSQTPASRLAALATSGEAGKVSVPNPGSRAADRSSSSISTSTFKPKKAPLMAKTLSLLKNRFRR